MGENLQIHCLVSEGPARREPEARHRALMESAKLLRQIGVALRAGNMQRARRLRIKFKRQVRQSVIHFDL